MAEADRIVGKPVADGIGRIPGFVNSYTFRAGEESYLIDTGFARRAKPILRAFEDSGVPLHRVGKILLTHHHLDHMGGAAYLLQQVPVPLACHPDDAPFVDGSRRAPMPLLMRLLLRVHPAPVATHLHDGDRVGPLLVLHVPGHTPGEIALYHPERKVLFSGDSVVERKGRLTLSAPGFASDLKQAIRSMDRLRALDLEMILPGHGVPVTSNCAGLLDDLLRRAPTEFPAAFRP